VSQNVHLKTFPSVVVGESPVADAAAAAAAAAAQFMPNRVGSVIII